MHGTDHDLATGGTVETTQLAVRPTPDLVVREPAATIVVDAKWRTIRERPYAGPADRPRSVVLLAALATLAICGALPLVFLLVEVIAR